MLDVEPGVQTAILAELVPYTVYSVRVFGRAVGENASIVALPESESETIVIRTDLGIRGEAASFGFVASQQLLTAQIVVLGEGVFTLQTSLAGGVDDELAARRRLTLTTAGGAADEIGIGIAHFYADNASALFEADLAVRGVLSAEQAEAVLLNVSALLRVGDSIDLAASSGEVRARVLGAGRVELGAGPSQTISLTAPAPGPALVMSYGGMTSSNNLTISFDPAELGGGTDAPVLNVHSNSLAIGSIFPSNGADSLLIERVGTITTASAIKFSTEELDASLAIIPATRELVDVRHIVFDSEGPQSLTLGAVTIAATGAGDGEIRVGNASAGVLTASSAAQTVAIGERISADARSGSLKAESVLAAGVVHAGVRLSVSGGDINASSTADSAVTFLEHQALQISNNTYLTPGALQLRGDGPDDSALVLCAGGRECGAVPSVTSASGALRIYASDTLILSAGSTAAGVEHGISLSEVEMTVNHNARFRGRVTAQALIVVSAGASLRAPLDSFPSPLPSLSLPRVHARALTCVRGAASTKNVVRVARADACTHSVYLRAERTSARAGQVGCGWRARR
jgi:hypothetical protein